ncbi:hypothetical protein ACER0C_013367 [Sarotherodon galilaeus]
MAAEQLIQEDLTLTRRVGESVSFSCRGTEQCDGSDYLRWYQKKENETFKFILIFHKDNGQVPSGYEKDDFSSVKKGKGWAGGWYYIFGSGTKLSVTDEQVVKPVVSVYPAASRAHLEGNSSLLCVASAMFPPLVQFSWKRQKKNGGEPEELPPAEGEQLELRESGRSASILLIQEQDTNTYKYSCWVKHEGGTVEAQTQQGITRLSVCLFVSVCPSVSFQSQCRVKLLCLLYTVLIVKSLVYCCGLSLLMILTNKGASTNCTHAD